MDEEVIRKLSREAQENLSHVLELEANDPLLTDGDERAKCRQIVLLRALANMVEIEVIVD